MFGGGQASENGVCDTGLNYEVALKSYVSFWFTSGSSKSFVEKTVTLLPCSTNNYFGFVIKQ